MAFNDNYGRSPRPMVQGNWTCAECGTEITELPFEPSAGKPIHCKECWSKKRNQSRGGGGRRNDFAPRRMVQGNWECSSCGKEITELPFEPREGNPIYCRDCWLKQRNQDR